VLGVLTPRLFPTWSIGLNRRRQGRLLLPFYSVEYNTWMINTLSFIMTSRAMEGTPTLVVTNDSKRSNDFQDYTISEKTSTPAITSLNMPGTSTNPSPPQDQDVHRDSAPSLGHSSTQPKDSEDSPPSKTRGWRFYGAFGTLCLVTFIIALDSTIICVALPVRPIIHRCWQTVLTNIKDYRRRHRGLGY